MFWADKIHKNGCYRWASPVHETLAYTGEGAERFVDAAGVQLDHHPDETKSRGQYLPLLELAVREDPQNDRNCHYLGREYMFRGEWQKAIETLGAAPDAALRRLGGRTLRVDALHRPLPARA